MCSKIGKGCLSKLWHFFYRGKNAAARHTRIQAPHDALQGAAGGNAHVRVPVVHHQQHQLLSGRQQGPNNAAARGGRAAAAHRGTRRGGEAQRRQRGVYAAVRGRQRQQGLRYAGSCFNVEVTCRLWQRALEGPKLRVDTGAYTHHQMDNIRQADTLDIVPTCMAGCSDATLSEAQGSTRRAPVWRLRPG